MDQPHAPTHVSQADHVDLTAAEVNHRLLTTLAAWGAASAVVGAGLWWAGDDAARRAFGRQTAAWGAVDLAIAGIGFARTRAGAEPAPAALRRTLGINAALDVGYVSGGWWLRRNADRVHSRWPRYAAEAVRGDGAAIMVQGGFLLALDTAFAVRAGQSVTSAPA